MAPIAYSWEEVYEEDCNCPTHTKCMRPATWDNPRICIHETYNFPVDFMRPAPIGDRWWEHIAELALFGIFICAALLILLQISQMLCRKRQQRRLRSAIYHLSYQVPMFHAPAPVDMTAAPGAVNEASAAGNGEAAFVEVDLRDPAPAVPPAPKL
uniref:Uncharacterized protein n=1 Tax=Panagrolaimus sp. PS1159 TaxID=55785 RepID=A0AC35G0G1_9BILA